MIRIRTAFYLTVVLAVLGFGLFSIRPYNIKFIQENLHSAKATVSSLVSGLAGKSKVRAYKVSNSDETLERYQNWIYSLHDRFRNQTAGTCVNSCLDNDSLCELRTKPQWKLANARGMILTKPLYAEKESVLPWEKEYLSLPPLLDIKSLPDRKQSVIRFISDGNFTKIKDDVSCRVNQELIFVLCLFDGHGRPRKHGGDEIRAWINGTHDRGGSTETFRAGAMVTDMKNGSYKIQFTCLWIGSIELKVGIVYPREYLRLAFHHSVIGSHRFLWGLFQRGGVEELTICFGTPNLPGRPCLCNYTEINVLPLYCGKPLDKRLGCEDLQAMHSFDNPPFKNFTKAERDMASRMSRRASQTLVPHNFRITVVPDLKYPEGVPLPTRECKDVPFAETWNRTYPSGFFEHDTWMSLTCKEIILTQPQVAQCLRNTRILLVGDSNALQLDTELGSLLGCPNYPPKKSKSWDFAAQKTCVRQDSNTSILFRPHEYPIYRPSNRVPIRFYGGLTRSLDFLPIHGRHIVLYHFYLHPVSGHLSHFLLGLYTAKRAFVRLLRRNPQVVIGIRGPHVSYLFWQENHLFGGDVLGAFVYDIYMDVFKDLKDRIVFLDGWERTTAIENFQFHAPTYVPLSLVRTFLSFYCE